MQCISVRCDGCGHSYDEMHTTPKLEMDYLKKHGWTGTYKKYYCPICSEERKEKLQRKRKF